MPAVTTTGPVRIHALDGLRAAMMLLGLWLHASCSFLTIKWPGGWRYRDADPTALVDASFLIIHVFRMPLFFVISGFLSHMLWERLGPREFLLRRSHRILLPLLLAWVVLWLPVRTGFFYASVVERPDALERLVRFTLGLQWLRPLHTMHLWFLHFLVILYFGAAAVALAARRFVPAAARARFERGVGAAFRSPARLPVLAAVTCCSLLFMRSGTFDTDASLIPAFRVIGGYAVFYAFGWLLFRHADLLGGFRDRAWLYCAAAAALAPVHVAAATRTMAALPAYDRVAHATSAVSAALMAWLLIFGLTGLFLRYFNRESERARYLADASYWMYLVHFPLTIWFAVLMRPLPLHGAVKFAVLLAAVSAASLASYELAVRYTWVGTLLNGKRLRRAAAAPIAAPGVAA